METMYCDIAFVYICTMVNQYENECMFCFNHICCDARSMNGTYQNKTCYVEDTLMLLDCVTKTVKVLNVDTQEMSKGTLRFCMMF